MISKTNIVLGLTNIGVAQIQLISDPAKASQFADQFAALCLNSFSNVLSKQDAAQISDILWDFSVVPKTLTLKLVA